MVTASNRNNNESKDDKKSRGPSPSNGHSDDAEKDGGRPISAPEASSRPPDGGKGPSLGHGRRGEGAWGKGRAEEGCLGHRGHLFSGEPGASGARAAGGQNSPGISPPSPPAGAREGAGQDEGLEGLARDLPGRLVKLSGCAVADWALRLWPPVSSRI